MITLNNRFTILTFTFCDTCLGREKVLNKYPAYICLTFSRRIVKKDWKPRKKCNIQSTIFQLIFYNSRTYTWWHRTKFIFSLAIDPLIRRRIVMENLFMSSSSSLMKYCILIFIHIPVCFRFDISTHHLCDMNFLVDHLFLSQSCEQSIIQRVKRDFGALRGLTFLSPFGIFLSEIWFYNKRQKVMEFFTEIF